MKPGKYLVQATWGRWALALLCAGGLAGCASSSSNVAVAAQERAQTQALAAEKAEPEKAPPLETHDTYLSVVRQLQQQQLWFASLAHLDALEKQWGVTPASQLLRADALRQAQRPQDSAALYRQLLGGAQAGGALYGLGLLAADAGDFGRAVDWMEQSRRRNPLNTRLLSDLGYAYLRAGHTPSAFVPLMQATQMDPEYTKAAMNLALYWLLQGEEAKAVELMEARQLSPAARQAIRDQAQGMVQGMTQGVGVVAHPAASAAPAAVVAGVVAVPARTMPVIGIGQTARGQLRSVEPAAEAAETGGAAQAQAQEKAQVRQWTAHTVPPAASRWE